MADDVASNRFFSCDGQAIASRTLGQGRPTLLIHGFLVDAELNWFRPGIAAAIAELGRQVIAPDLRGHGASAAPTELAQWPTDVLAMDQEALIAHLGLTDYDLVGYSLGARTAARMMVRGARPGRAVLGGMGDTGVMQAGDRAALFEDAIKNGDQAMDPRMGRAVQGMMRRLDLKPEAMLGVLAAFAATTPDELRAVPVPTLVVCGAADHDNGSAEALAALLPLGRAQVVHGDHTSAVADPSLTSAIVAFLRDGAWRRAPKRCWRGYRRGACAMTDTSMFSRSSCW
ncbi:MAG TPA: alpha/beta fold hydrolase [Caulobacteraceae bacterium]|jgi:pimeloyl-ACP methyl ester carboxylesterase